MPDVRQAPTVTDTSVRILSINVRGLASKLQYYELVDVINKYDLICLTETKKNVKS